MTAVQQALDAALPSIPAMFAIEQVSFDIGGRELLARVSFQLGKGQVHGLIGHNGSGKSTLLKILARQYRPSHGRVAYDGVALDQMDSRAFARKVAYLPQQTPPAPGLLVKELVAFGRYPWHGALGRFGAEDRRKVDEAIELTDIADFANRPVDMLSGGERQRCWLAMLVAQDADCLLLDEPISALDIAHQIEVLTLVRRLAAERNTGVVIVLHDINMAARFCDEIVALHSGQQVAQGRPSDIMTPERLRRIYGVDMDVFSRPGSALAALPQFLPL
ncbi:ABC transporter ATP-binding protein [Ensifer sp. 4252]|uniref:ABC transporter ATP-binding protein n=1 Tax=Ensifer sp. 4252 TaxID=3373915 RepID=UPI003D1FE63D